MFSNIGVPGLILIIIILAIVIAVPTAIIFFIIKTQKRHNSLRRIEEKLDQSLSSKGK
ncbi:hypothetical protein [Neobacillus vireti]|uniref:DUF4083 domain-containing protein n=1 Tax=Neobacillus vireti LMG 21834 TaxID=1131730 RepID=A0AB94IQV8_9BACI|nr:hypothetical protein [Neobacillus vireti]ETI69383.1 hypothetical protein BAVI_07361 [Neobacillus vireti LMG 21834]